MRNFLRLILLSSLVAAPTLIAAQNRPAPVAVPPSGRAQNEKPGTQPRDQTKVDETFDLNIAERRITKEDFAASTSVGTEPGAEGLNLQIGVGLTADRIDVLLRNVRGQVRFRGTLQRVLDAIESRRPAPP